MSHLFRYCLCLYLLLLALLPCADAQVLRCVHEPEEVASVSQAHDRNTTHQHDGAGDVCTPFCTCACCGLHPTLDPLPDLTIGQVLGSAHKIYLCRRLGELTSVYTLAVWHPPRRLIALS